MQFHGFDWDDGNVAKCQKHGLSIGDIEAALEAPTQIAPDDRHSWAEERFIAIAVHATGRAMFVAFTLRERDGKTLLRPISARFMHAKEAFRYGRQR